MRKGLSWFAAIIVLATGSMTSAAEVGEHVMGDENAPITMIEYASLTCPHCAAFNTGTLPAIKEQYIDTGKVKLVVREFPLDQIALAASVIAQCAGDERYFSFIDAMFSSQEQWARADDPIAALIQLAQLGGLSPDQSRACLDDKAMGDAVLQMRVDGVKEFDVNSTPTFIINGETYSGDRPIDEFAEIFDDLLD
ncbi:MAG: DsbA family protein [Geminicoccaceae bacterium]|nr:DsbA family protein [Geminicoccaceae bacterium]